MTDRQHLIVIGGGVIGLAAAAELAKRGRDVTLLERDRVGGGASRGNAGQICPDLAVPLPSSHSLRLAAGSLWRRGTFLHLHPTSMAILAFLLRFGRASSSHRYRRSLHALSALAAMTPFALQDLVSAGLGVALNTRPYLLVFTSRASAEKRLRGLNEQWAAGGHPAARVCDYRELAALEPCLAPAARAGVVVEGQVAVNPSTFVDGLARLAASRGVHICEHTPVTGMDTRNGSVSVRTAAGDVGADTALIAAGVWSHDLLVPLGVRLGIVPGKGYSFSVDVAQPPKHVIMLEDAHIATLPLDGETRMSGAMDLDEDPERFEPQRIATLISAAGTYFNGVDWSSRRNEWVGPRPLTPTGLPFIGAVDAGQRVFVAAGHNMLGVTLAPATAIAVADLICDGQSRVDMQPFAPVASRGRVH